MRRNACIATACLGALLLIGCAAPPSHFYTLGHAAPPGTAVENFSIVVGPVSIPAMVDLPQIVVNVGPNQVTVDEFNRWASPLQDNISRVIAENLVAILGTPRVWLFQQALNVDADYRVAIEIQRFESAPGDAATINAVWIVRRSKDGKTETGRTTVREPTQAAGYEALAAAHSRALARMSQDIADSIRTLARGAS
jgi:uncharacterized lipoprotein YmbA